MSSHRRRASKQPDQRPEDDDRSRLLAGKERRLDEPAVDQHVRPVGQPDRDQGDAGRLGRDRVVLRGVRADQPLAHPGGVLYPRAGGNGRHLRDADRAGRERDERRKTFAPGMSLVAVTKGRHERASRATASREDVDHGFSGRLLVTSLCYVVLLSPPLLAQRSPPFDQQLRDNQRRLEDIRRERSQVEQELERLRTEAHSLTDELSNIERQKETTNRIVNELDRQINGLTSQIDRITVDLLLAEDALVEKQAVLERRLVDIYKRGPLYAYQVLFAAESFGDLLSRYKYLYLVSRQDRLLANDMTELRNP